MHISVQYKNTVFKFIKKEEVCMTHAEAFTESDHCVLRGAQTAPLSLLPPSLLSPSLLIVVIIKISIPRRLSWFKSRFECPLIAGAVSSLNTPTHTHFLKKSSSSHWLQQKCRQTSQGHTSKKSSLQESRNISVPVEKHQGKQLACWRRR